MVDAQALKLDLESTFVALHEPSLAVEAEVKLPVFLIIRGRLLALACGPIAAEVHRLSRAVLILHADSDEHTEKLRTLFLPISTQLDVDCAVFEDGVRRIGHFLRIKLTSIVLLAEVHVICCDHRGQIEHSCCCQYVCNLLRHSAIACLID